MNRRLSGTPTERINTIVDRSFPRERIEEAIVKARELAADPEFGIDLDHPSASGIGRAPREADMSVRAMCRTAHLAASGKGILIGRRGADAILGALLEEMSAQEAIEKLTIAIRYATAIVEDERPKTLGELLAARPEEKQNP